MRKHTEGPGTLPGKPVARRPRRGRITGATNEKRAPLNAAEARQLEEAETARLMQNWASWKSGVSISVAVSSAFNLEARGRRGAVSVPLINGEAADVDAAVDALPRELRDVVVAHWLSRRPDGANLGHLARPEHRAQACGCEVRTYYRRLEHAHGRIRALMRAKRDQAERAREAYRAGAKVNQSPKG